MTEFGNRPVAVSQVARTVQGVEAIPVYVTDEAGDATSAGGLALPIYAVTDADIATGKFKVKGGSAVRVMISRSVSRGVQGGPAIPVRKVGGPGVFA